MNLAISLQYLIFLITIEEEITLPGPTSYSLFKNIILHTASIVEGTLHYTLQELIRRKELDENKLFPKEDKYRNKVTLFTTKDEIQICGIHYSKKPTKLKQNSNFIDINRACKRGQILNKKLFDEVEILREKRNKFHLAGLTQIDNFYTKQDVTEAFKTTQKILSLIESKLAVKK